MAVPSPRTLEQILAESASLYTPQIESIQKRVATIPTQIQEQEKGLAAQQEQAFGNILSGARRRGTGIAFGGIPLAEQAQYSATSYMPALANLRQAGIEQEMSLQDAINQIRERQQTAALGQQQYEQSRFDAYNESLRKAATDQANAASYLNALTQQSNITPTTAISLPKIASTRDNSGRVSYNFTDYQGKPINAAEYVALYNASNPSAQIGYRQLLQQMATDGDVNAKVALQYVGDDAMFGAAPEQYRGALTALGATGNFTKTTKTPNAPTTFRGYNLTSPINLFSPTLSGKSGGGW